jgi:SNF2 family DNA or RNA helicase
MFTLYHFVQGFVVLDGSTPAKDRHVRLNRFKQRQEIRIALVSVTAGGQGLDLSAASVGVFVELPPDVGWCRQASIAHHSNHPLFQSDIS